MEFNIKSGSPEKQRVACVIVGVYEARKLSFAADLLDRISNGFISDVLRRGDMEGKLGSTLVLHSVPHTLCDRVMLVGLGKERDFREKEYRDAVRASLAALAKTAAVEAVSYLTELTLKKRDVEWMIETAACLSLDAQYRFDQFKSKTDDAPRSLRKLTLSVSRRSDLAEGEVGLVRGLAIANGMKLARDLGNLPGNVCTPAYLADTARALAERFGCECTVLEQDDMAELGMGSLLSVGKGSIQPPKLIVLKHNGGPAGQKPVVLVGKGITFEFARPQVDSQGKALVERVIATTGQFVWVEAEEQLGAVTALSGSGPAYVFLFLEAMTQAGVDMGLPPAQAYQLAVATFQGASELAARSPESAEVLRQRVTSKGGTTHAAITHLQAAQVPAHFIAAMRAAEARAKELAAEFGA